MDTPLTPSPPLALTDRSALCLASQMSNTLRLIRGAIHEINNDLGPLVGYLSIMEIGASAEPKFIEAMQESVHRLQQHLSRISDELKHPEPGPKQRLPFEELVDQTLEPLKLSGFFRRVGIDLSIDPSFERHGIPWVEVCPVQFRHLITNLLANAIDATISHSKDLSRIPRIELSLRAHPSQVQVQIRDHGSGLDGANQPQVFEAFYSKQSEPGLGLGLCVGQDLAQSMGATLEIEADPKGGSQARVTLRRVRT